MSRNTTEPKRHGNGYRVSTENARNRLNVTRKQFETLINFDETVNEYAEHSDWIQYKLDGKYVGYYAPLTSSGFVSALGLVQ